MTTENDLPSNYDYEPAENSVAKDIVMDVLERELEGMHIDVYGDDADNPLIDLISLADTVVESLLAVGVTIPSELYTS